MRALLGVHQLLLSWDKSSPGFPTTKETLHMATSKAKKGAKKGAKKAAKKSPAKARVTSRPKMSEETRVQLARGKKLSIKVKRGASFDVMVRELRRRLIIDPGIIGPRGCAPCHSGIDFSVFGEELVNPR